MNYVLDFIPPLEGMSGEFNTIRIGITWAKKLKAGDLVFLMNNKERAIFGTARVIEVHLGTLEEICQQHGHMNHTQKSAEPHTLPAAETALRMMQVITKIYGPHIALPSKKTTAIYLSRVD